MNAPTPTRMQDTILDLRKEHFMVFCGRYTGLTTALAMLALREARSNPNYRVACLSPTPMLTTRFQRKIPNKVNESRIDCYAMSEMKDMKEINADLIIISNLEWISNKETHRMIFEQVITPAKQARKRIVLGFSVDHPLIGTYLKDSHGFEELLDVTEMCDEEKKKLPFPFCKHFTTKSFIITALDDGFLQKFYF